MFELCRKIVAGPKKKLQWNDKELDLTYVTDRIIAMAFPASGLQSAYRNSIKDVSQYLQQKHGNNYLIINVSARKYDYKFFNNNVLQYEWRDHLSPPLSTLFEIGREMYEYLNKNKNNVVAVHCNHGKGRTGTTIISFLLFTGFFQKYDQALTFYNKRRFVSLTYGVSQPCQKRYLNYFETLKQQENLSPKLISYKLKKIKQKGLPNQKYYIQISSIRKVQSKYQQLFFSEQNKNSYPNVPLIGDICIQVYLDKWNGEEEIAMINCHTFFFDQNQNWYNIQENIKQNQKEIRQGSYLTTHSTATYKQQKFLGKNIKVNGKHSIDFEICLDFEWFCFCHLQGLSKKACPCQEERIIQEKIWRKTIQNVETSKKITKLQACALLFSMEYLHGNQFQEEQQKNSSSNQKKLQSSKNTETSPMASQSQKYSNNIDSQNSFHSSSATHKTQDDSYQNQQFEYDMVIMNRNSANSV